MATVTSSKTTPVKPRKRQPIRTYEAALNYLFSQTDYEQMLRVRYNRDTFSLDRMRLLLKKLGDPHARLKCVHVAGTKGKGSTCTMLAQMLQACGYKVGLYTSPHMIDIRERIVINGDMITQAALTRYINQVAQAMEKMEEKPTFFELFTAIAFLHFAAENVNLAVVETGLGGRLDSTNVITPLVVGLTSISLDHMQQLGTTIEAIASEKAGIIKPGVPAISCFQPPSAKSALKKAAAAANAPLFFTGDNIDFSFRFENSRDTGPQTRVCLTTPTSQFEHLPVPLAGEHQAVNCGLALALLDQLKSKGFKIDDKLAIAGLQQVRLGGRMEKLGDSPTILADGAHNAASIECLMRAIGQYIPYDSMVVIFGCAADKDIAGMLDRIIRGADKVIFTHSHNPRAADPQDLAGKYEEVSGRNAQVCESLKEALRVARSAVSREDLICVTGSFYLVGEAKQILAS
jgi:dihydrofolate synthase/folylpolyglutamate synthase